MFSTFADHSSRFKLGAARESPGGPASASTTRGASCAAPASDRRVVALSRPAAGFFRYGAFARLCQRQTSEQYSGSFPARYAVAAAGLVAKCCIKFCWLRRRDPCLEVCAERRAARRANGFLVGFGSAPGGTVCFFLFPTVSSLCLFSVDQGLKN